MQAIGAQYPYDHCGYGAGHQAAVAERVRHREYPRAQTSFQQMYQSLRVSAKNSNPPGRGEIGLDLYFIIFHELYHIVSIFNIEYKKYIEYKSSFQQILSDD